jgi:predicted DNA-binding protein
MVRPWVKVSLCQYEELKRLREKKGKPLSQIIREAVCEFLKKKDFPADTTLSSLARGTRNRYKSVSAYFPRSDWSLLASISKETGRCKTHLIREAVDNYLGSTAVQGKRERQPSNDDG